MTTSIKGTPRSRMIWCDLYKSLRPLGDCFGCFHNNDCPYREKGAMRKVKEIKD